MNRPTLAAVVAALLLVAPAPLALADPPTTRPDGAEAKKRDRQSRRARQMTQLDRLRVAMNAVELDDATRAELEVAVQNAMLDAGRLGPALRAMEPAERRAKNRELFEGVRAELAEILPDDREPAFFAAFRRAEPGDLPAAGPVAADPQAGHRGRARQRIEAMWQAALSLDGLNDEQRARLETLRASLRGNLRAEAQENPDAAPADRQAVVREELARVRRGMAEILTVEQRAALRAGLDSGEIGGQTGRYLRRLERAVADLDLDAGPAARFQDLTDALRDDLAALADEHAGDRPNLAKAARARLADYREAVAGVLDDGQRDRLREALAPARRRDPKPAEGRGDEPGISDGDAAAMTGGVGTMTAGTMAGGDGPAAEPGPVELAPPQSRFLDRLRDPGGLAVGDRVPEGLTVLTAVDRPVALADLLDEHRPTVLLLGSASSPTFRDRAGDLRWLAERLRVDGVRRAGILVVYTREQHPAEEWQAARNVADGFVIPAHEAAADRLETAGNFGRWANLRAIDVDVVADSMGDAALTALAGGPSAVGNFAFVLAPDGTVIGRQRWFDPTAIPAMLE